VRLTGHRPVAGPPGPPPSAGRLRRVRPAGRAASRGRARRPY